jgi:hypothetical protein
VHDPIGLSILNSLPPTDFQAQIDRLEKCLQAPPYDAIEQEWQRTAKQLRRKNPQWYSLFGGPTTIRDLAYHLKKGFWYEFQYSDWSETVHAASALRQVAKMSDDSSNSMKAIRPLRHPDGLKDVCNFASVIAIELEQAVATTFLGPVAKNILHDMYLKEVRPRIQEASAIVLKAAWS